MNTKRPVTSFSAASPMLRTNNEPAEKAQPLNSPSPIASRYRLNGAARHRLTASFGDRFFRESWSAYKLFMLRKLFARLCTAIPIAFTAERSFFIRLARSSFARRTLPVTFHQKSLKIFDRRGALTNVIAASQLLGVA